MTDDTATYGRIETTPSMGKRSVSAWESEDPSVTEDPDYSEKTQHLFYTPEAALLMEPRPNETYQTLRGELTIEEFRGLTVIDTDE
jgi:hypothetical protein